MQPSLPSAPTAVQCHSGLLNSCHFPPQTWRRSKGWVKIFLSSHKSSEESSGINMKCAASLLSVTLLALLPSTAPFYASLHSLWMGVRVWSRVMEEHIKLQLEGIQKSPPFPKQRDLLSSHPPNKPDLDPQYIKYIKAQCLWLEKG